MQEQAREEIYHGSLINLYIETLSEPSGGTSRFEIVEHPGGVAIVALRNNTKVSVDPEVVLVRQKRPAIDKYIWEIPAGMVESKERDNLALTAARELREETGCIVEPEECEFLVRYYPTPGFCTEMLTIYLVNVPPAPDILALDAPTDSTEIDGVKWMPLSAALDLCRQGEIVDGKTLKEKIVDGKTLIGLYMTHNLLISEHANRT